MFCVRREEAFLDFSCFVLSQDVAIASAALGTFHFFFFFFGISKYA